jgi:hypothetical protein
MIDAVSPSAGSASPGQHRALHLRQWVRADLTQVRFARCYWKGGTSRLHIGVGQTRRNTVTRDRVLWWADLVCAMHSGSQCQRKRKGQVRRTCRSLPRRPSRSSRRLHLKDYGHAATFRDPGSLHQYHL